MPALFAGGTPLTSTSDWDHGWIFPVLIAVTALLSHLVFSWARSHEMDTMEAATAVTPVIAAGLVVGLVALS
jgi:hypothetical protein